MHEIAFSVDILQKIRLFQITFNSQEDNLKVWPLIKSGYCIIPNLSTTLLTGEKRTQGQSERPRG